MSMVTTCPNCHTTFKVSLQQLEAYHGDVRCGRCTHIFNAFDALATLEESPLLPEQPQPEEAAVPAGAAPEITAEVETFPAAQKIEPPAAVKPALPEVAAPAIPPTGAPRQKRRRRWGSMAAVVLLLLLLPLQGAYFYRSDLAVAYPEYRPYLQLLCDVLQCRIELQKNSDLLGIETSALQAEEDNSSVVVLTATLRNRAPFPQAYPALELTLTNAQDKLVARRHFTPAEYLPKGSNLDAGMPPDGEVAVRLRLGLGDMKAIGYRLLLFYS